MVKKVCSFIFRRGVSVLHFLCLSTPKIFSLKCICWCFAYLLGGQKKPLQCSLLKLNPFNLSWLWSGIVFHLCDTPSCYPPHKHTPPFWSDSLNFDPVLEGMVTQTILLHSRQGTLVGVRDLGLSLLRLKLSLNPCPWSFPQPEGKPGSLPPVL